MRIRHLALAVASLCAVTLVACNNDSNDPSVTSAEFIGMDAPSTADQKADMYTSARLKITYSDGTVKTHDLAYHKLYDTTDIVGGNMAGGLIDHNDGPLTDNDGQMASDAPDGTSLMQISGLKVPGATGNSLAMVTNFEYKELPPNDGTSTGSFWSKMPATMGLTLIDQAKATGLLSAKQYQPVSFRDVNGGWIHCGSTLSGWNTHIGSEEYEPDAKTREGFAKASNSDDGTDINSFSKYYFGDAATANPYHYGLVPEVTVASNGIATVVKHYAPGRYAREMQEMAADNRTAISGDDGAYTGLFMFVADNAKYLSAGTIYAAKVTQTSTDNGGGFTLRWIKLGHATDAEIKTLVDGGIKFSDIFDVSNTDPSNASYTKITTYMGTEWLRLKTGMEQAAAFLETRRYAALMGATTEFSKMEYVAFNKTDKKFYLVVSRVEKGMTDTIGDIQVARNDGGIILEMATAPGQKDMAGNAINSEYVGTTLTSVPELAGGWNGGAKDAEGNQCTQDKVCGADNIKFVDSIRTLFIGEDTSRRNNNYVWAFNIDTRKLSRILSTPMNAEATGLMIAPDYNGHAYIMSNFQHPGEDRGTVYGSGDPLANYKGADKDAVLAAINSKWGNRNKAAVGYIGTATGALPKLK